MQENCCGDNLVR